MVLPKGPVEDQRSFHKDQRHLQNGCASAGFERPVIFKKVATRQGSTLVC